ICSMVKGLTKIRLIVHKPKRLQRAEYIQKILLLTTKDVRIIIVKLFDKLHNMRTIDFLPKKKQKRIAQEVLDIYAPLAHKLGIHILKHELFDLAFPIANPKAYNEIERKIIVRVHKDEKEFLNAAETVKKLAAKNSIDAFAYLRHKSPFAVFKKMETRQKSFEEVYDYILITVLVDSVPECYELLGIIHNHFTPIPLKMKDYIAIPEPNLYQGIHTSVLTKKGKKIKFYIMTRKMAETNKLGIISLLNKNISKKELNEKIGFLKNISKIDKTSMNDPKFLQVIKTDFLGTRMFVFSPTGEIVELQFNATPIDYAFKIGLNVAPKAKKALINGKLVSLSHRLSPGDMVEIIPAKTIQINYGWLKIAKSNTAVTKIKELLKKKN
ncbi:MAG: HD domain-containing protein, partial [archaeon]|nr:HD domain-containing protein [archaeon]